jgi:bifunctional non-homologous end joining protein LigD
MAPSFLPMHPTLVAKPFHHEGWVYEEKVDGWRMLAQKDGPRVRLISRHGTEHTHRFPKIVRALLALSSPAFVLDGEVAAFEAQLVSRFEWLRRRPHGQVATLPVFMVFDCLRLGGDDLRAEPLRVRRQHVEHVLDDAPAELLPVRRLVDHGRKAWQECSTAAGRTRGEGP